MISFDTPPPDGSSMRFACSVYTYTNFHFERHTHFYHELVLIQRGRIKAHVGGKEYLLGQGDLIVYPANTDHEEWVMGERPLLTSMCAFSWEAIGPGEAIVCHDTDGHMEELLAWLARECYAHWPITGPSAAGKDRSFGLPMLHAILAELKRLSCHEPNAMVDQVRAFIRDNLRSAFTFKDLLALSGLGRSQFAVQYRRITGRSPMEDARLMRVEEARRLIITSPLTLSEIAPMVGMLRRMHLSRLLKTVLGVNVRDLRPTSRE